MEQIKGLIHRETELISQHPFLRWFESPQIQPAEKLKKWVPVITAFALSFKDFCNIILKYPDEEAKKDELKSLINHHGEEDGTHWQWLLMDIKTLDCNNPSDPIEVVKFLWGKNTEEQRRGFYDLSILVEKAKNPILRFCLIAAFEACGEALFQIVAQVADDYEMESSNKLWYFGRNHADIEDGTLQSHHHGEDVQKDLWELELDPETLTAAESIVRGVFAINSNRWDHYLSFCQKDPATPFKPRS